MNKFDTQLATLAKSEIREIQRLYNNIIAIDRQRNSMLQHLILGESLIREQERDWWQKITKKYSLPNTSELYKEGLFLQINFDNHKVEIKGLPKNDNGVL